MKLLRFRPAGETRHDIKLLQELRDDVFCVGLFGEPIEVGDDFQEGVLCVFNGLRAEILTLGLKTFVMLDELFPVKLGESGNARWRCLIQQETWNAGSSPRHIGLQAV